MAHDLIFISQAGAGPEPTEATRGVIEATGVDGELNGHEAGSRAGVREATRGSSPTYAGGTA